MEASPVPAKRIEVGEVVSEAFSIYRDHLGPLLGSAIVVFAVVGVAAGLLVNTGGVILGVLAAIVRVAGQALYTGFVVRLVEDVRDGRRDHSVGDLFSAAAPAIGSLIVFGILSAIGVGIGFILLVIPGLILATFWSLGPPAIVVESAGPIEAFGRSWQLVRGNAWSVFWTLLVVLLILIAIGIVLGAIGAAIGDAASLVANVLSGAITAPIFALAVSVIFFDLGGGREAAAPPISPQASPPPAPPA
jgi:uncharacterized protein UPF0259